MWGFFLTKQNHRHTITDSLNLPGNLTIYPVKLLNIVQSKTEICSQYTSSYKYSYWGWKMISWKSGVCNSELSNLEALLYFIYHLKV